MTIEIEPFHKYPIILGGLVTDGSRVAVQQNGNQYENAYETDESLNFSIWNKLHYRYLLTSIVTSLAETTQWI